MKLIFRRFRGFRGFSALQPSSLQIILFSSVYFKFFIYAFFFYIFNLYINNHSLSFYSRLPALGTKTSKGFRQFGSAVWPAIENIVPVYKRGTQKRRTDKPNTYKRQTSLNVRPVQTSDQ